MLPAYKTENDNSLQKPKYQYLKDSSSGMPRPEIVCGGGEGEV